MLARRTFLAGAAGLALLPWLPGRARAALSDATLEALASSGFVYVSPLRSDGSESTCHGEVWFSWQDDKVVLITASDRWKARSMERGLDRARIWVGDHGRWKRMGLKNEDFRKAPSFEARAVRIRDEAVLERLLADYEKKYPKEIASWRDKFRAGFASGERVLIGYEPV